jgi:hypothetical protein
LFGSSRTVGDKIGDGKKNAVHGPFPELGDSMDPIAYMAVVKGDDNGLAQEFCLPQADGQKLLPGDGCESHGFDDVQMGTKTRESHALRRGQVMEAENGYVGQKWGHIARRILITHAGKARTPNKGMNRPFAGSLDNCRTTAGQKIWTTAVPAGGLSPGEKCHHFVDQ